MLIPGDMMMSRNIAVKEYERAVTGAKEAQSSG
jgi:hypothetical protein